MRRNSPELSKWVVPNTYAWRTSKPYLLCCSAGKLSVWPQCLDDVDGRVVLVMKDSSPMHGWGKPNICFFVLPGRIFNLFHLSYVLMIFFFLIFTHIVSQKDVRMYSFWVTKVGTRQKKRQV